MFTAHISHLAPERMFWPTLLTVEALVLGISQLDEGRVPAVTSSRTARNLGFDGGIVAHRVHPNSPVMALCLLLVSFARVLQPHLDDCLSLASVFVDNLAESDVAPGVTIGMVKRGDGGDLVGLVRVPAPANTGAGPPVPLPHLVDHDGAPDDGVRSKQRKVGVVVNLSDGLLPVQHSVLPAEVPDLVLVLGPDLPHQAGAVDLPGVEVSAHGVSSAGEL